MGKTGNTYQFGERFRFRIDQHLPDERRTEFRDSQTPDLGTQFFRRQSQGLRRAEQAHRCRIVEGNGRRLDARQIFQHADDCRIIMAEDVQFDQTAFDRMVIKVGRNDT